MNHQELKEHMDNQFAVIGLHITDLRKDVNSLNRSRTFLKGVWHACSLVGAIGVVVLGFIIKAKLF